MFSDAHNDNTFGFDKSREKTRSDWKKIYIDELHILDLKTDKIDNR